MALIIFGQGFLAVDRIAAIHRTVEQMEVVWLPAVSTIKELNLLVAQHRMAEARHIMAATASEMSAVEKDMKRFEDALAAARAKFEKIIPSEEERELYREFSHAWEAYLKSHAVLLRLSRDSQSEQAGVLFKGDLQAIYETVGDNLAKLTERAAADVAKAADVAENTYATTRLITFVILGLGVAIAVFAVAFSFFGLARPIGRITDAMGVLADGNTEAEIPYGARRDELGRMAAAVRVFKDNMLRARALEAEQKEAEMRVAAARQADMHRLADGFEAAVGNIIRTVSSSATELEAAAGTLTNTAEQTQQLAGVVASASEQASANVQSVASATDELAASVSEIGRQVQESSRIANQAVQQAQQTDARITELSQAASRIGDVIKLITAIAEQTNLLALNATIEAARAGDAGRGFAVVAQEVKALAAQTAKATGEIGTQIAGMQSATQESVTSIKAIGGTIDRISEIASSIAAAIEEQGAATQEISRNVQEAATGTVEVANNIRDVNRGANETGSASGQVLSSAQALSREGGMLRLEVDKFLATVRAA